MIGTSAALKPRSARVQLGPAVHGSDGEEDVNYPSGWPKGLGQPREIGNICSSYSLDLKSQVSVSGKQSGGSEAVT